MKQVRGILTDDCPSALGGNLLQGSHDILQKPGQRGKFTMMKPLRTLAVKESLLGIGGQS